MGQRLHIGGRGGTTFDQHNVYSTSYIFLKTAFRWAMPSPCPYTVVLSSDCPLESHGQLPDQLNQIYGVKPIRCSPQVITICSHIGYWWVQVEESEHLGFKFCYFFFFTSCVILGKLLLCDPLLSDKIVRKIILIIGCHEDQSC